MVGSERGECCRGHENVDKERVHTLQTLFSAEVDSDSPAASLNIVCRRLGSNDNGSKVSLKSSNRLLNWRRWCPRAILDPAWGSQSEEDNYAAQDTTINNCSLKTSAMGNYTVFRVRELWSTPCLVQSLRLAFQYRSKGSATRESVVGCGTSR